MYTLFITTFQVVNTSMPVIVTEQFSQNLYADPKGTRQTTPTIFDELRWAMQHSQKPLEQTLQLISEFHGLWTGMNAAVMNLIQAINNSISNKNYVSAAQAALKLFNSLSSSLTSTVGRQNNIQASQMSIPLLREFVSKCQALHPAISNYIQLNIGKYPHFQQISESVCQHGQIVLHRTEVPPVKTLNTNGATTMTTSNRLRRVTESKLFDTCKTLVNDVDDFVNVLFLRSMPMQNNMGLLNQSYGDGGTPLPHGHNYTMDGFNAQRGKDAITPSIMKATERFGPSLQLVNNFFPVEYEIVNTPQFFILDSELGSYVADKLNRPLTYEPIIPIADDNFKSEVA